MTILLTLIKKKAKEEISSYQQQAQAGEIRFFYCDEIKLMMFATLTRMWVKTGSQAEILTDDNHDTCYGYTAFDWVTKKIHFRMSCDLSSKEFKKFVKQLTEQYPGEKLVIIVDNASIHGYRTQRGEVVVNENLIFYFLPSYTSMELNLIERVFKSFRHKVTHNHYFETISDLMEAARNFFRYLYVCRNRLASIISS